MPWQQDARRIAHADHRALLLSLAESNSPFERLGQNDVGVLEMMLTVAALVAGLQRVLLIEQRQARLVLDDLVQHVAPFLADASVEKLLFQRQIQEDDCQAVVFDILEAGRHFEALFARSYS